MNNSPGWASPGSSPSDEPDRGPQEQPTPPEQPTGTQPADADASATEQGTADQQQAPTPQQTTDQQSSPGQQSSPASQQTAGQPPSAQWAKDQPPAGQWSAPSGGAPTEGAPGSGPQDGAPGAGRGWGGQQGWNGQPGPGGANWGGGRPGWGGAWSPPPPAAKPGVIPLRPLGVNEILDGAVATMRAHWRTMMGISLVVAVITQAVATVVTGVWFQGTDNMTLGTDPSADVDEVMREAGGQLAASGITWFIAMLGTVIVTALITIVVSRAVLGRSVSAGEAWRDSRRQLPRLFGLLLLLPLLISAVITVGLVPGILVAVLGSAPAGVALALLGGLAGLVAGVWLWICYCLAAPALMLEKQGVITSMRRSAKLVRGAWWRVLGIQLLTVLIVVIVEFIVQIPATIIAFVLSGEGATSWMTGNATTGWTFLIVVGIGAVISSTVTFPISAGVTALLYMDQRIRREALDLELARAAGLPGYGADEAPASGATPGS
ncbi:DUF7544 domain-containing protein [Streptomyces ochraceiscleroticus]|uniref:Glycerophosphoryl diester phosphodiesterase membrane domain-containing protein n=1 Tax=Streptomyces ochraceiscleroticus TaxID=47761 RepID=A0ABW1MCQ2_9ACTN|nr:membrane protein [Streptomyces ochraceiscleroticus]